MRAPDVERTGKPSAEAFHLRRQVAQAGKVQAIRCFLAALESFMAAHNLTRAEIAETCCGVSESYFSKLANGQQGDLFALAFLVPADIRIDFFERLAALEQADPQRRAAELLALACIRYLSLATQSDRVPEAVIGIARAMKQHERSA